MIHVGCSPVLGVRLAGGNVNNGANAGAAYSNTNNAASNSNANISAPQCYNGLMGKTLPLGRR